MTLFINFAKIQYKYSVHWFMAYFLYCFSTVTKSDNKSVFSLSFFGVSNGRFRPCLYSISFMMVICVQSTKIIFVIPKCKIFFVPFKLFIFPKDDRTIRLFSIVPCNAISISLLWLDCVFTSLLLLDNYCSSNYRKSNSCCSFYSLKQY